MTTAFPEDEGIWWQEPTETGEECEVHPVRYKPIHFMIKGDPPLQNSVLPPLDSRLDASLLHEDSPHTIAG